jgi:hypothetical protein
LNNNNKRVTTEHAPQFSFVFALLTPMVVNLVLLFMNHQLFFRLFVLKEEQNHLAIRW